MQETKHFAYLFVQRLCGQNQYRQPIVGVVIEDIVDELDPHSVYIPAVQKQALSESMQGNFMGIGVSFFMVRDTIAVVRVLEGGPSEKAGLKSGDQDSYR